MCSIVAGIAITETSKEETQEDGSQKEEPLESKSDDKREDSTPEGKKLFTSPNGRSPEGSCAAQEQDVSITLEEVGPGDLDKSSNSEVPKNQPLSTTERESDDSKKSGGGTPGKPSEVTEALKDVEMFDSLASERNESQQPTASNLGREASNVMEASKDIDVVSGKMPGEKTETEQLVAVDSLGGCPQSSEAKRDLDMISEPQHSGKGEPTKQVASSATFIVGSRRALPSLPHTPTG